MSTKVKRYGWKSSAIGTRDEYATKEERDRTRPHISWQPYTVTRTVRAKGRPLWWAIKQLQEGRAVVDGDGETWAPEELTELMEVGYEQGLGKWAQSWTLAEVGS